MSEEGAALVEAFVAAITEAAARAEMHLEWIKRKSHLTPRAREILARTASEKRARAARLAAWDVTSTSTSSTDADTPAGS